ncbi:inositol monophosphatase [Rhizobiaceae bacterium n13]|uniref:Inositol-1-monophosphatase n=2 Tax=Ferirhizobium litorale TaxID=2927786 RepID=A0AAE3QGG5_9HYPH|nr:inositol monophosphatase [Fererhizobium litorale]MDI7924745.1 inositol monophosphatase [Fererhizobium litorale]
MDCEFPDNPRFVLAREAIFEAGRLALESFADLANLETVEKFNGQDIVSAADKAVEALIRARISAAFPEDGILGEEQGLTEGSSDFVWVIDPIDGTSCFVHGLKDWCVSVAVLKRSETVLGLICQPTTDEFFAAKAGGGAFLNGRPISVDTRGTISTGLLGVGANFRIPPRQVSAFIHLLLEAGGMFIRSGSGALMLAHVACGRLIGYYEPHINSWDCLAALCLIREAGGWTADFPIPEALLSGCPVIAAAPSARDELQRLVAQSLTSGELS